MAGEAATSVAAAIAAALVARAEAGGVNNEADRRSIVVGRAHNGVRQIRDRGPVLMKHSFPEMGMHVRLGRSMMGCDARRISTGHAGGENRQADREDRDEYRPQLVQRWAASVRVCNEMSSRRTDSSKVRRGFPSEFRANLKRGHPRSPGPRTAVLGLVAGAPKRFDNAIAVAGARHRDLPRR